MIPFSRPHLTGKELTYMREAAESLHWSGDGPFGMRCSERLSALSGRKVLLTNSGTAALELALMALHLAPGDEVVMPSYTFPSTANAAVQMGLTPVFVDVRPDTLNIDEARIEAALSPRTKAVMVVHYAGVAAEMDEINRIARKHGLAVVEDAAHGVGAFYKDRPLGALGDLGAFSFHQTKNLSSGEGGAVIAPDGIHLNAIEIHRQKGTNRTLFLQGKVDKYSWVDRGSNYLLSDLLAAFLCAQLEALEEITEKRGCIFKRYQEMLSPLQNKGLQLPHIPPGCRTNYHLFHVLMENNRAIAALTKHLKDNGIETATHFVPLHSSVAGRKFGNTRGSVSITERIAQTLLRLPLYPDLSEEEQAHIVKSVKSFFT